MNAKSSESVGRPSAEAAMSLLLAVASEPDLALARQFDDYFYPFVLAFVRKRNAELDRQAASKVGGSPSAPLVGPDRDTVAHDAAVTALRRARGSAHRFDPSKGDAYDWVLRAAVYAYRDVVRDHLGARRKLKIELTDDEEVLENFDNSAAGDAVDRVTDLIALEQALYALGPLERLAVVLVEGYGLTEPEVADQLFGSREQIAVLRVGETVRNAKLRLAELLIGEE